LQEWPSSRAFAISAAALLSLIKRCVFPRKQKARAYLGSSGMARSLIGVVRKIRRNGHEGQMGNEGRKQSPVTCRAACYGLIVPIATQNLGTNVPVLIVGNVLHVVN